jgi:hypothetical protein
MKTRTKEEIFEAAFADNDALEKIRAEANDAPQPRYSPLTTPHFDMDRVWSLMDGAIDLHIHSGPDAYNTRVYDDVEMSVQACQVGMKAIVFKCQSTPSSRSVYFVQKDIDRWAAEHNKKKLDVFGGVVLNYSVGGLNPEAVNVSSKVGGKFVWLPNVDASFHHKVMGMPGGIDVLDENDRVVQPLREILAMIAEGDMVLSLCHQGTKERFIIIDEAKKMGVKRIEVCHPNQITAKMTIDQMKIAAEKGAYISFSCAGFLPSQWSWNEFMQATRVVGYDHLITSTDCGNVEFPSPLEAMRLLITGMLKRGIADRDVARIVKDNPSALLY